MTRPPGRGPQPDPARRPALGVTDLRGRLRSGFGSPEGVVYAGIGSQYQDTSPTGAGAIYKKTTASGNTGWVELGSGGGGVLVTPHAFITESAAIAVTKAMLDANPLLEPLGGSYFVRSYDAIPAASQWLGFGSATEIDKTSQVGALTVTNDGVYVVSAEIYLECPSDTAVEIDATLELSSGGSPLGGSSVTRVAYNTGIYDDNTGRRHVRLSVTSETVATVGTVFYSQLSLTARGYSSPINWVTRVFTASLSAVGVKSTT